MIYFSLTSKTSKLPIVYINWTIYSYKNKKMEWNEKSRKGKKIKNKRYAQFLRKKLGSKLRNWFQNHLEQINQEVIKSIKELKKRLSK